MMVTTTAGESFSKIYLDIVGQLPYTSDKGNRYILTIQDELSKYSEAFPIPTKDAKTVGRILAEEIFLRYGISREIATDQGKEFLNETLSEICKVLQVSKVQSTAYHHESLGALENSHKALGSFLRSFAIDNPTKWDDWIRFFTFAYNNAVHLATGYSPFELVFGRRAVLPSNAEFNAGPVEPVYNIDDYAKELKFRLQTAQKMAQGHLIQTKMDRKEVFDRTSEIKNININDLVYLKNETGNKLEVLRKGPFKVVKVDFPNCTIRVDNKRDMTVHQNRVMLV